MRLNKVREQCGCLDYSICFVVIFFSSSTDRTLFIAFQHRNIFSVYWRAVSFLYFFFGVDYRIYHSDCISTVKLIVRFFRDMYIFYLKTYNKTCKLDYTLFVPHNQYMYFQGLSCTSKKQKAKKKNLKKMEKIPSIFGVNVNLAVRSEYANAFLIGPNLHSLFVLRRVVKSTLQICLIYWCNIIDFAFVRKTRKPNNSY